MQINKHDLITLLALVGLFSFFYGEHIFELAGPNKTSFLALVLGLGLCLCALILTWREKDKSIRFGRILLIAMIGLGICSVGFAGMGMKEKGSLALLYYTLVLASIIILCIALWFGYREFGHCEISLRN
jgi:hypothetical protein